MRQGLSRGFVMLARTTRRLSSHDSTRQIIFSRINGRHALQVEDRYWCLFLDRFPHSSWDSNEPFLGAANLIFRPVKSQVQVSIFCIKTNQWKSCYVENVCLKHKLSMNILFVVCKKTRISIEDYFFMIYCDCWPWRKSDLKWELFRWFVRCLRQLCDFHPRFMKVGL